MNNCIYCGAPLDGDSQFCSNCGKKIEPQGKTCPRCGNEVGEDSAFCAKCGMRLDAPITPVKTQTEPPVIPIQETEEKKYNRKEEKDKKWWFVFGGVIIVVILAIGWYIISNYNKTTQPANIENVALTPDEETIFIDLIKNWDDMHINKGFADSANCPYAETVYFYGMKMSGIKAAQEKQKVLATKDYSQECTNIKVTRLTDKLIVCDFEKHTNSNGKSKVHPNCFLYFSKEDGEAWKIKEESDLETDKNLLEKRTDSYDEVTLPITLQYIREYCDHLKLPYSYWTNVENTIIKEKLNVYHYYDGLWCEPYEIRGDIVMDYKYGQNNPVIKKMSRDNYDCFCDAIGRIKEVWNVVPVRVENNNDNEPPLIQFKYEGKGFENIIINAEYIEDGQEEMDDIPIYHYNYVDNGGNRVALELIE